MKVLCPTCGFENQAEMAQAICARCATIIKVQEPAVAGVAAATPSRLVPRLPETPLWPESDDEVLDLPHPTPRFSEASDPEPVFDEDRLDEEIFVSDAPKPEVSLRDENYVFLPGVSPSLPDSLRSLIGGLSWSIRLLIAVLVLGGLAFHFQVGSLIFSWGKDQPSSSASPSPVEKAETKAGAERSQPPPRSVARPASVARVPEPRRETKPRTGPSPPSQGFVRDRGKGDLTLQVASYAELGQANERAARLQSAGVRARVVKAAVPGQGVRYRVLAGRFTSAEEAKRYGQQLRAKGAVRDFIVTNL